MNEKDFLLSETRPHQHKKFQKEFLNYLESRKIKESIDEDATPCMVCLEDDYDDNDLIISCTKCEVNVHMQCYGIAFDVIDAKPLTEIKNWTCDSCLSSYEHKNLCALCPIISGVLKPTISVSSSNFPKHLSLPVGSSL